MFKISDEDIRSIVQKEYKKAAKERGLIKEEKQRGSLLDGCGKVSLWPKLELDKMVGKGGPSPTAGRDILLGLNVQGTNVLERIKSLHKILNSTVKDITSGGSLVENFNNFIFVDTLYKLANKDRYDPSAAGHLLEPILAAVLKGTQLAGPEEMIDISFSSEIENKEFGSGISLKFISEKTMVTGSFINFLIALLERGEFYFVALVKNWQDDRLKITFYTRLVSLPDALNYAVVSAKKSFYNNYKIMINADDAIGILKSLALNQRHAFAREVISEIIANPDAYQGIMDVINLGGREPPERPGISFDIKRGEPNLKVGVLEIPSVKELGAIANRKIKGLDEEVSQMYNKLGALSCIMTNYIRYPEIEGSELGRVATPVIGDIQKVAESLVGRPDQSKKAHDKEQYEKALSGTSMGGAGRPKGKR